MNRKKTGFSPLNAELLTAVALCMAVSLLFFFAARALTSSALERYFSDTNYIERKTRETAAEFQTYVTKNDLASTDADQLAAWAKREKLITFCIVAEDKVIFDSSQYDILSAESDGAPGGDDSGEMSITSDTISPDTLSRWFIGCETVFRDRTVLTYWMGAFDFQFYLYCGYLLIFLSSLMFIVLLTLMIRKKLRYINQLEYEIHILEGGNLEYEITVQGKDELTVLAASLNSMRRSLLEQIEAEKQAHSANKQLVAALSHDLRTPLTTQMAYLEIIKERHWSTDGERDGYIEKCLSNCRQIKAMSDRLFEYFLAYSKDEAEEKVPLQQFDGLEILSQLISEKTVLLEEKGFHFILKIPEQRFTLQAREDYLFRIFDNVFSNIEKYAAPSEPVRISIRTDQGCALIFENAVKTDSPEIESTKIGLESIRSLMERQNGSFTLEETSETFRLTLHFPANRKK